MIQAVRHGVATSVPVVIIVILTVGGIKLLETLKSCPSSHKKLLTVVFIVVTCEPENKFNANKKCKQQRQFKLIKQIVEMRSESLSLILISVKPSLWSANTISTLVYLFSWRIILAL